MSAANSIGGIQPVTLANELTEIYQAYENHSGIKMIKSKMAALGCEQEFSFSAVTHEELYKKLTCLKTNKSCGFDGQPAKLIKAGASVLSYTLLPIVNKCLINSVFPTDLKYAEVTPVFKKDDSMSRKNYRPVSVLVCQSKLFENFMSEQLMTHLLNKLSPYLAAYRKGYSTQHVLIRAVESWKLALDKGEHVGIVLMDLSKAFDALPHALLIAKLKAYNLSDSACEMVKSYLTMRNQRVKIGTQKSEWKELDKGVPQGSICGPDYFNIFINDLFYCLDGSCDLFNYADDNTLSENGCDIDAVVHKLEAASCKAVEWFDDNCMQANADKFQVSVLSRDPHITSITLHINDVVLTSTDLVKLVGVKIDRGLTFHHHISDICRKASYQLSTLMKFSGSLDIDSKLTIFNAFIASNFMYCPIVWHLCSITDSRKIDKVQENALRFIYNDYKSSYQNILMFASKDSLYISRLKCIVIEIFKALHNISPVFMKELFTQKSIDYDLRDENVLVIPRYNTVTYGFNSLRYQGTRLWKSLECNTKSSVSLNDFKRQIAKWKGPACNCGTCLLCSYR